MSRRLLVINGSLGGSAGNTAQVLNQLFTHLEAQAELQVVHLTDFFTAVGDLNALESQLRWADGFIFATGTYWDSWGSPLQVFLEATTHFEAGDLWMGKPACAVVTMHSVGGKEVLSRLQGVLSTLGLMIPPMSGMVYSLANHLALDSNSKDKSFHADLWQLGDLKVLAQNLIAALRMADGEKINWTPWPVDSDDPYRRWL